MKKAIYKHLASLVNAAENCKPDNHWRQAHLSQIKKIMDMTAPSGSGIDSGTDIHIEECTNEKLVFSFSIHHMNDDGYYTHWTHHELTCKASLLFDVDLYIHNENELEDYIDSVYETYEIWLKTEIDFESL